MEMILPSLLGTRPHNQLNDRPNKRPTDGQTGSYGSFRKKEESDCLVQHQSP